MKHKQFKKLLKSVQKFWRKNRRIIIHYGVPLLGLIIAFLVGGYYQRYQAVHTQPKNIVWAVDKTVTVPSALRSRLMHRHDCQNYKGTDNLEGVGLWAVTQIEQGSFAKLAYGCSWSLSDHAVAVKQATGWLVIPPEQYFTDTNQGVPLCTAIVKYKIPPSIEGFCGNDVGKLTKNPNPEL